MIKDVFQIIDADIANNVYYISSIQSMLNILSFFNSKHTWHLLMNRHLQFILPTLADLIHLNVVDYKYYLIYDDLVDYKYIHSQIIKVYPELQ